MHRRQKHHCILGVLMALLLSLNGCMCSVTPDRINFLRKGANLVHRPDSVSPRFIKLDARGQSLPQGAEQWVMVRDESTGLIWEVKTEDQGPHDYKANYAWDAARSDFIAGLNRDRFGNADDWRLPTVWELSTLTDKTRFLPAIDIRFFPNTYTHDYWSATPDAADPAKAWRVHFCRGLVHPMPKSNRYYVRAVRGPRPADNRLVDNGDGTLTDTASGLMWQQKVRGPMSWPAAISYCHDLKTGGYRDWRLPHAHELQSLIDYRQANPAAGPPAALKLKPVAPEKEQDTTDPYRQYQPDERMVFWSSTIYASNRETVWAVDFKHGSTWNRTPDYNYFVRAVRGTAKTGHPAEVTLPPEAAAQIAK